MTETWAVRITAGLFLSFLIYIFFPSASHDPRPEMWKIQVESGQVSILGLTMGQNTLQDAMHQLKKVPDTAMFTTRQRKGDPEPAMRLEAYFEDLFDEGDRVIVGLNADEELLQHIKKQAFEPQLYPDGVVRVNIHPDLASIIQGLSIHNISIIPGYSLYFEDFQTQFGEPFKIIDDGIGNAHLLYPELGLDFIQPSGGTQILQFVTPDMFDKELLEPLLESLPQGEI